MPNGEHEINLSKLSEADICRMFITPAIKDAGWNLKRQVREQVTFTDGRIKVRGQSYTRGSRKRADYILYYKPNIPLAVIEAKDAKHSASAGIQQAHTIRAQTHMVTQTWHARRAR